MKCAGNFKDPYFSPVLLPNLEVIYPNFPPLPGQKIIGYNIYPGADSCFVLPCQREMNLCGVFSTVFLFIFCWPAFFLPMCFGCSYSGFQIPVYR